LFHPKTDPFAGVGLFGCTTTSQAQRLDWDPTAEARCRPIKGNALSILLSILYFIVLIFFIALIGRLIFDWIQLFARYWKPKGFTLMIAEAIFTVTDPPMKAIRRVIPPLRLGSIALDVAFLILIVACSLLMNLLRIGIAVS
jgi:YggT family protein